MRQFSVNKPELRTAQRKFISRRHKRLKLCHDSQHYGICPRCYYFSQRLRKKQGKLKCSDDATTSATDSRRVFE